MLATAEKNLTIREALSWAEEYLQVQGVPDCKTEAEYLLAYLLNCKRSWLYLNCNQTVDSYDLHRFTDFIERRIKREPSQYILGEQEFYGLTFKVNEDVLIPRPETEVLVEEAVKTVMSQESEVRSQNTKIHYSEPRTPNSKLILDLCTGSGCIAISLAKEIPNTRVFAVDISEKALDVARENAERYDVADRITFLNGDLFEPLNGLNIKADIIVSNPPYISKKMFQELQPEVKDYEPVTALYGGGDGLDFYRRIVSEAPAYLAQGGYLMLELGYGQVDKVKRVLENSVFKKVDIIKDLSGIKRVVRAQIKH